RCDDRVRWKRLIQDVRERDLRSSDVALAREARRSIEARAIRGVLVCARTATFARRDETGAERRPREHAYLVFRIGLAHAAIAIAGNARAIRKRRLRPFEERKVRARRADRRKPRVACARDDRIEPLAREIRHAPRSNLPIADEATERQDDRIEARARI